MAGPKTVEKQVLDHCIDIQRVRNTVVVEICSPCETIGIQNTIAIKEDAVDHSIQIDGIILLSVS